MKRQIASDGTSARNTDAVDAKKTSVGQKRKRKRYPYRSLSRPKMTDPMQMPIRSAAPITPCIKLESSGWSRILSIGMMMPAIVATIVPISWPSEATPTIQ